MQCELLPPEKAEAGTHRCIVSSQVPLPKDTIRFMLSSVGVWISESSSAFCSSAARLRACPCRERVIDFGVNNSNDHTSVLSMLAGHNYLGKFRLDQR